jgi:hypothetical protein
MHTNPDEPRLALWLEDELEGEELAAFEQWMAGQPEHLAAREEVRRWRRRMAGALPASEEPPYPEFFNHRVGRAIRDLAPPNDDAVERRARIGWRAWFMPLAACAGMVLAFWSGIRIGKAPPEIDVTGAPRAIPVDPILYTPESGMSAEWFASADASATVIVLNGLAAIPDATDILGTASLDSRRAIDSTADLDSREPALKP